MTEINAAFPFALDAAGRTDVCGRAGHVRQMIEQVLMTTPGERVNRPRFGCELRRLIFLQSGDVLSTAVEAMVHSALTEWLGDVVTVRSVDVAVTGAGAEVALDYNLVSTGERDGIVVRIRS